MKIEIIYCTVFFYSWIKCDSVCTFFELILYDFDTIFSINLDGTRWWSIDFLNCDLNRTIEIYLKQIAKNCIGFLVILLFLVFKKLIKVMGVCIIDSCNTPLGNGWKYHRSWYIINFLDLCDDKNLIGSRPIRLSVLWYRTTFGLNLIARRWSLIASIKFRIAKNKPKYFRNCHNFPDGILVP